ncbi:hypothetical protein QTP88_012191 [Uroleucon formosanum]
MADYESANFDEIELTVINEVMEDIMITLMIILLMEETCTVNEYGCEPTLSSGDEDCTTSSFAPTIVKDGPDGNGSELLNEAEEVSTEDRELNNSAGDLGSTTLQEPVATRRRRPRFSTAWSGVKCADRLCFGCCRRGARHPRKPESKSPDVTASAKRTAAQRQATGTDLRPSVAKLCFCNKLCSATLSLNNEAVFFSILIEHVHVSIFLFDEPL